MTLPTMKTRTRSLAVPLGLLGLTTLSLAFANACTSTVASGATQSGATGSTSSSAASSSGTGGAGTAMNCPPEGPIDPTATIDDMEDGDGLSAPIDGRDGRWWSGGDATPNATLVPMANGNPEMIPGGRCDSHYAMRVTGQGFKDWGAVLQLPFRYTQDDAGTYVLAPYDASSRKGITFWARVGDTSTNIVRFAVADEHARPEAGICIVDGPIGQNCYDTFGIPLPGLDTAWKQYKIPFDGLSQRMFGVLADTVDTASIYTVEFSFEHDTVFDFWVDDVAFY